MSPDHLPEEDGEKPAGTVSVSRRSVLRAAGAGAATPLLAGVSSTTSSAEAGPWTIVAIPDTQYYANSERRYRFAVDQTDWIAANADAENIAFVSHEGDVVHDAAETIQWERMDEAMSTLDGVVPYSTVTGNHDYADVWDRSSGLDSYVDYFGASRFDGYDWYGGTGPDEANSYQLFSAGGYDFLHLALEWEPRDATIAWAQNVLGQYPDRPTVVTTHAYLTDGDKYGGDETDPGRTRYVQEDDRDGNSGEQVWQRLVSPNPQVFMVLNGHFHENLNQDADPQTSGEYRQVSANDTGQPVYEMLANYQSRDGTGFGRIRLIRFVPDHEDGAPDRIQVRTYISNKGEYETDDNSEFAFDLDFDQRFAPDSSVETVSFQQGSDGYEGTSDTTLLEATPETGYGTAPTARVDTAEPQRSGTDAQALVRFDDVVGDAEGQVPTGATVNSARLTVETVDEGDGGAVHRLLSDWSESDTWASLDDGISADGSDATADAEWVTGPLPTGTTSLDVTAGVQAWVDGEPNHGWAILPLGDDGWEFSTAEGTTTPVLTVTFEPGSGDDGGDGGDDGGDDSEMDPIGEFQNQPTDPDSDGRYEDINGDGESDIVDVQALFKNSDDETIQNNPDAFDFNGDGSVDVVDVQKLFNEVLK
jgi:hypothetical protein